MTLCQANEVRTEARLMLHLTGVAVEESESGDDDFMPSKKAHNRSKGCESSKNGRLNLTFASDSEGIDNPLIALGASV
ncbi:hypothetical protein CFC21_064432 [Triticum aestivum]|uniref:Uncharacterized protein n=2 Tax=Triticum aestivum TaxID=4565 RepID=A0A3B6KAU7_WHEAT|nr:hypothetical protein CFC21_064432 [Triticum aestivum]